MTFKLFAQLSKILFGLFIMYYLLWIINADSKPEYQMKLVDTGVVVNAGCVYWKHKARTRSNCSVDVRWKKNGLERMVVSFGVLPDDSIGKWCGTPLWNEYKCQYGRLENEL